ncbi:MAG TPA: IS1380 family transposase, partial [Candidatus Acidoferrum sp.]|nr:IS1380 family transposase [Candidatus Acidoferrum sp.]
MDFDATDDPLHGSQQGAYFRGYYRHYCYLPLYYFCGNIPLFAKLRDCKRDASDGTVEALQKIVPAIRQRFGKKVRIIVRADSGFAREAIMAWCEENHVFYCLGLARNDRLAELLRTNFEALRAQIKEGKVETPCRSFTEFEYSTLDSWTKARRVIGKAEILSQGDNPRFIVTNLPKDGWATRAQAARFEAAVLYEKFYCARGDMENRIKEQQMDLFADRTSTHWLASNQLRLWFSA